PALRRSLLHGLGIAAVALSLLGVLAGWPAVAGAGLLLLAVVAYRLWPARPDRWLGSRVPRLAAALQRAEAVVARGGPWLASVIAALVVWWVLGAGWEPLGPESGVLRNFVCVGLVIGGILGLFWLLMLVCAPVLGWCLAHKFLFLCLPLLLVLAGGSIWL